LNFAPDLILHSEPHDQEGGGGQGRRNEKHGEQEFGSQPQSGNAPAHQQDRF
jgi:hypothetical protein